MGIYFSCCGTRPPKKYIGTWTNGDMTVLHIGQSGGLRYVRHSDGRHETWMVSARYDEDGFWTFNCCSTLSGKYMDQTRKGPAFLVKNEVLTKPAGANYRNTVTTMH